MSFIDIVNIYCVLILILTSELKNSNEDCYDFTKFSRVEIGKMGDCTRAGMGPGDAGMNNQAGAGNGYKCK